MRIGAAVTVVCLLTIVAACTDSSEEAMPDGYAVVTDDDWELQEAVRPAPDDPIASSAQPPMDWYSEHVRTLPVAGGAEGQMVRLSGHSMPIGEPRAAFARLGFEFEEISLDGWEGVGGTAPSDPTGPSVVLLGRDSLTLVLLSYELSPDDLALFAGSVEAVDEETWVASGGVIRAP